MNNMLPREENVSEKADVENLARVYTFVTGMFSLQ